MNGVKVNNPKESKKPRNHVALAMIRSGKTHQVHGADKSWKEILDEQVEKERFEELYRDWD